MSIEKDTLDDFGFDTFESAEDFMKASDEIASGVTPEKLIADALDDNLTDTQKEAKEKDDLAALEKEVFGDFLPGVTSSEEEIEEVDNTLEKVKPTEVSISPSKSTLEFLKKKNLVEYELEEGIELTDDLADELVEKGWETSIEKEIDEMIAELPAEGKGLLKIMQEGGDTKEYLRTLVKNATSSINKDTDMAVEENQILAITVDLQKQEYDAEYIETHIQALKDSGKLAGMAEKVAAKIVTAQEKEEASMVTKAAEARKANAETLKNQKAQLKESLTKTSNIKGIIFNDKDKKELPDYMNTPAIELADGKVITKMHHELFKALADKEKSLLLGKLLLSDFDFSSISNATITEYSKGIKAGIQNTKDKDLNSGGGNNSGSSQKQKRTLADRLG